MSGTGNGQLNESTLERYERDDDGNIIIDVSAARVEELYNNFDKNAPYIRRDLDPDLVDYLIDCTRELGRHAFVIRFSLDTPPDEPRLSRVRRSVNAYFLYLAESEMRRIMQMFRRSAILFAIGLGVLFLSVSINQALGPDRTVTTNVFAEGLTVAAWVSLWEAIAVFLIEWFPHRANILLYRRIATSPLLFQNALTSVPHPERV